MRIVDLRTHKCFAGWRNWVFVEVETDTGLTGVGEATLEGRELTVEGHLEDVKRYLIGRDATAIAEHRMRLNRDPFWVGGSVAMTGLAAVELALWDILGKSLNCPVWQLLGGKTRNRVRAYANGWYFGAQSTEEWAERAGQIREVGYTAMKFDPFGSAGPEIRNDELERAVEVVAAVRQQAGPGVDLMIEAHGRFDLHAAGRVAAALQPFDCYWLEEPVQPGNDAVLSRFAAQCPIAVAAGERLHSIHDFSRLIAAGNVSVLQPDVIHAGGLIELQKIAGLAEAHNLPVAPHNPNGPVATAASVAFDVVTSNFLIQEMLDPWDVAWRNEIVEGAPIVESGYLEVSDRPGLGVTLDVARVRQHPYKAVDPGFYSDENVLDTVDLKSDYR